MMLTGEARVSTGSQDSARFVVLSHEPDVCEPDASDFETMKRRALLAESRVKALEEELLDSNTRQAHVEMTVCKTTSENEEMKQRLSELQRKLERSTEDRHERLFLNMGEADRARCKDLEAEVAMFNKYVKELQAANEAIEANAKRHHEYVEVLQQQVALLDEEKRELEQRVNVFQMKWFDTAELSIAQLDLETEKLQHRLEDETPPEVAVGPVVKSLSGSTLRSTEGESWSESTVAKSFSDSSTSSHVEEAPSKVVRSFAKTSPPPSRRKPSVAKLPPRGSLRAQPVFCGEAAVREFRAFLALDASRDASRRLAKRRSSWN